MDAGVGALSLTEGGSGGQVVEAAALPRKLRTFIMDALAAREGWQFPWVFNGMDILMTTGNKLPATMQFQDVQLDDGGRIKHYNIDVKEIASDWRDTGVLLQGAGQRTAEKQQALSVLDTAVKNALYRKPDSEALPSWRTFFFPNAQNTKVALAPGLELLRGFTTAVRPILGYPVSKQTGPFAPSIALNVDMACSVFRTPEPALDLVCRAVFNRAPSDFRGGPKEVANALSGLASDRRGLSLGERAVKGVRVETRLTKRSGGEVLKRTYVIKGLSNKTADGEMVENLGITVQEYLEQTYNYKLKYPQAPMLWSKSADNPAYLPLELCMVVRGQLMRKIPAQAAQQMPGLAGAKPKERIAAVHEVITEQANLPNDPLLRNFGMSINPRMLEVDYRVLPAPTLAYGGKKLNPTEKGEWWFKDAEQMPFVRGAQLRSYAILSLADSIDIRTVKEWYVQFMQMLASSGVAVTAEAKAVPPGVIMPMSSLGVGGRQIRDALAHLGAQAKKVFKAAPQIFFVVIPRKGDPVYPLIKRASDGHESDGGLGVASQCSAADKNGMSGRGNVAAYMKKLAMKVNAKLNGINQQVDLPATLATLDRDLQTRMDKLMKESMVFGADVTHAAPGSQMRSIAAVVGSINPTWTQYAAEISTQEPKREGRRVEMIQDIGGMVQRIMTHWTGVRSANAAAATSMGIPKMPKRVFYYRDGVSEGEFQQVIDEEIRSIRTALIQFAAARDPGGEPYRPFITAISVQKRHHAKFVVHTGTGPGDWANPQPGTVIDSGVAHPVDYDFFLAPHKGQLGTLKPVRCNVLRDESNLGPDILQLLTYWQSYLFSRCVTPISMPSCVQYAHLLAARGRCLRGDDDSSASEASFNTAGAVGGEVKVHNNLAATMFFV